MSARILPFPVGRSRSGAPPPIPLPNPPLPEPRLWDLQQPTPYVLDLQRRLHAVEARCAMLEEANPLGQGHAGALAWLTAGMCLGAMMAAVWLR